MKKIKHSFAVLLFATLLLIPGCTGNQSTDENTNPSTISDTTTPSNAVQDNGKDYSLYAGTWAQEEIGWLNGGVILDISVEEGTLQVAYHEISSAPISKQVEIYISIPISDIQDDRVEASFENDGWDNAGTMRITFIDDQILCKISDVHYVGENWAALWGATVTTSVLVRMDNAHDLVEYTLDDYYEMFPNENPDNWIDDPSTAEPAPSENLLTANGILASLGITEEEFRQSCVDLGDESAETRFDLKKYPADYIGKYYTFTFPNMTFDGKPLGIQVSAKGITADGYIYYRYDTYNFIIYDLRDDPYYPTISKGDNIIPYMIFAGVETGYNSDALSFYLISID